MLIHTYDRPIGQGQTDEYEISGFNGAFFFNHSGAGSAENAVGQAEGLGAQQDTPIQIRLTGAVETRWMTVNQGFKAEWDKVATSNDKTTLHVRIPYAYKGYVQFMTYRPGELFMSY